MTEYYGGAYFLDSAGKWRYAHNWEPVPGSKTYITLDGELTMAAPELLVHQMLDMATLAEYLGLAYNSVTRMTTRDLPAPQIKLGQSPLWAKPIIDHWKSSRPGKGRKKAA